MNKKNKRISKNKLIFIITIILFAISLFFWISKPLETREVEVRFVVGEKIGLIADKSKLDYGVVPRGSLISKNLFLKNDFGFPVLVKIYTSNEINNFIYSRDSFYLNMSEQRKVNFKLIVPENADYGNYSGRVILKFYRA